MEISGKNIIVTGGPGGIGSCVVKKLLEKNAIVAAVSIKKEKLNLLKDRCSTMADNLLRVTHISALIHCLNYVAVGGC